MSQEPVVQLLDVSKVFHDLWGRPRVTAVEGLSLEVGRGEVLGLLGPNGAGKSTTIKLLLGLLHPTRGKLAVFGRAPRDIEVRRRTGYLPEETRLHKFLTAEETVDFFGQLLGLERTERRRRTAALLEMVGLTEARGRTVGEMSKGMARRIGLAVALVSDPELVVLDEPTSGLDPIGTREVKDLVIELARRGKTILLSSHLLSDVEDACHRIAILYGGKLRAVGRTEELLSRDGRIRIELDRPAEDQVRALEAAARLAAGGKPVVVGSPRDRLEAFFLRVVGAARAEHAETAGAREGTGVATFLGAERLRGPGGSSSLPGASTGSVAAPSLPGGAGTASVAVSSLPGLSLAPEPARVETVAPLAVQAPAPVPVRAPVAAPAPVPASTPSATGSVLDKLEAVAPREAAPAAPSRPLENPKTRAVLDRLLAPKERSS